MFYTNGLPADIDTNNILYLKTPPKFYSYFKAPNMARYFIWIVCWQMIHLENQAFFPESQEIYIYCCLLKWWLSLLKLKNGTSL